MRGVRKKGKEREKGSNEKQRTEKNPDSILRSHFLLDRTIFIRTRKDMKPLSKSTRAGITTVQIWLTPGWSGPPGAAVSRGALGGGIRAQYRLKGGPPEGTENPLTERY